MWLAIAVTLTGAGVVMHDDARMDVETEVTGVGCAEIPREINGNVVNKTYIVEIQMNVTSYESEAFEPAIWTEDKIGSIYYGWESADGELVLEPGETEQVTLQPRLKQTFEPLMLPDKEPRVRFQRPGQIHDLVLPNGSCSGELTYNVPYDIDRNENGHNESLLYN